MFSIGRHSSVLDSAYVLQAEIGTKGGLTPTGACVRGTQWQDASSSACWHARAVFSWMCTARGSPHTCRSSWQIRGQLLSAGKWRVERRVDPVRRFRLPVSGQVRRWPRPGDAGIISLFPICALRESVRPHIPPTTTAESNYGPSPFPQWHCRDFLRRDELLARDSGLLNESIFR